MKHLIFSLLLFFSSTLVSPGANQEQQVAALSSSTPISINEDQLYQIVTLLVDHAERLGIIHQIQQDLITYLDNPQQLPSQESVRSGFRIILNALLINRSRIEPDLWNSLLVDLMASSNSPENRGDSSAIKCMLCQILRKIGSFGDAACDETIFGILGDPSETCFGNRSPNRSWMPTRASCISIAGALCQMEQCCENTTTLIEAGFNGTFSTLVYTNSLLLDILLGNSITVTLVAELSGIYTAIAACCNATQTSLNLIYTTEVAGFNSTFTAIAACCNSTQTELNLIYTTLVAGFNGTYTAIAAGFNGTFSSITAGFNATQTELNLIYTTEVAGFNGTFTAIGACCNSTQTELTLIYTTLVAGFNGTYTAIAAGFNGTFSAINTGFNTTQTELTLIYTTIVADFNGTFSAIAALSMGTTTSIDTLVKNICSPTLISQSSLPFTINSAGRYVVVQNLTFAPAAASSAITISASNVTLDLLCFGIQQTNGTTGVSGVTVSDGLSNITIKSGGLTNFLQSGIRVNSGVLNLTINGITVTGGGTRGIELIGTTSAPIQEGSISNCSIINSCTQTTADNALTMSNCRDFEIENLSVNKNGSTGAAGAIAAVKISNSIKLDFEDVTANDNVGNADLRGFSLAQASLCVFNDCEAKNNNAAGATSINKGFQLEGGTTSTGNLFNNCNAENITGVITVDGFLSETGCNDNTFKNCTSLLNQASGATATTACHGFRTITNSRNLFMSCIAKTNTAPASTVVAPLYGSYGFKLDNATGCSIRNCTASDQTATRAVGIFLTGPTTGNSIISNIANRNSTFGFDAAGVTFTSQSFVDNYASKNAGAAAQYTGFPAGSKNDSISAATIATVAPSYWSNVGVV